MISGRTAQSLLGLVLLVLPLCPQAHSSVVSMPDSVVTGTGLLYVHKVEGGPIYDLRAAWSPVRVKFNCTTAAVSALVHS